MVSAGELAATPVRWHELQKRMTASASSIFTSLPRLKRTTSSREVIIMGRLLTVKTVEPCEEKKGRGNCLVKPLDDGHDGDDRRDADHYADERQSRAQLDRNACSAPRAEGYFETAYSGDNMESSSTVCSLSGF